MGKKPKKGLSEREFRRVKIEALWDEIEKMAMGLQSGMLEAFEMFGVTLEDLIENTGQADMILAVLFEVLPPGAQEKLLADARLEQSQTILPMLKELRAKGKRPKKRKG